MFIWIGFDYTTATWDTAWPARLKFLFSSPAWPKKLNFFDGILWWNSWFICKKKTSSFSRRISDDQPLFQPLVGIFWFQVTKYNLICFFVIWIIVLLNKHYCKIWGLLIIPNETLYKLVLHPHFYLFADQYIHRTTKMPSWLASNNKS